jgi:tetratricopeptide (TPR) repeat protein
MRLSNFINITVLLGLLFACSFSVLAEDVRYSHDKALLSQFNSVLTAISSNDLEVASREVLELKTQSAGLGYEELSEFSFRLIRSASSKENDPVIRKKLLNLAEQLSPNHPGVLLAISSFSDSVTMFEQLAYVKDVILNLHNYPLTSLSLISRFIVIVFVSIVLAAFCTLILILISSFVELRTQCAKLFSRRYKKIGSGVLLFGALILPGFLPLMAAMLLWSLLLTISSPRFWWLSLVVSIGTLYAEFMLEPSIMLAHFSESPSSRALESVANRGFSPRVVDYVDDEMTRGESGTVWCVILGQLFQSRGDEVKALEYYEKARLGLGQEQSISYLISFNTAVNDLEQGRAEKAFAVFTELSDAGWQNFELLYNLSLVSSILHKTELYDRTFKLLQSKYSGNLEKVLKVQGDTPKPILGRLPNNFFMELVRYEIKRIKTVALATLSYLDLIEIGVCIISCIFSLYYGLRKRSLRYSRTFANQRLFQLTRRSRLWSFMPLGWTIREGRLLNLFVSLTIMKIMFILITAQPLRVSIGSIGGFSCIAPILLLFLLSSIRPGRGREVDVR